MSNHRKVAHLTSAHTRYDSRVFQKEAMSTALGGYEAFLVVADGGEDELKDGVQILCADVKRGRLGRLLVTPFKILAKAAKLKANIYHFHDPELIPVALILKLLGFKIVYDIHENVGLQLSSRHWVPRLLRKPLGKLVDVIELIACRFFDAMVVPQPSMQSKFGRYGRTALVANFVELNSKPMASSDNTKDSFIVFHAGALSRERGLFSMLEVANQLVGIEFVLAGRFASDDVESKARAHPGWGKVNYLGVISKAEANDWYARTSLGIILYQNVGQYYMAYAIKLFEYMERGIPIIMPNFGDWLSFSAENGCGICVDVDSTEGIAREINNLRNDRELSARLGLAGRFAVESKYNWGVAERELLALYRELL